MTNDVITIPRTACVLGTVPSAVCISYHPPSQFWPLCAPVSPWSDFKQSHIPEFHRSSLPWYDEFLQWLLQRTQELYPQFKLQFPDTVPAQSSEKRGEKQVMAELGERDTGVCVCVCVCMWCVYRRMWCVYMCVVYVCDVCVCCVYTCVVCVYMCVLCVRVYRVCCVYVCVLCIYMHGVYICMLCCMHAFVCVCCVYCVRCVYAVHV